VTIGNAAAPWRCVPAGTNAPPAEQAKPLARRRDDALRDGIRNQSVLSISRGLLKFLMILSYDSFFHARNFLLQKLQVEF
jgi:hypothetical protein